MYVYCITWQCAISSHHYSCSVEDETDLAAKIHKWNDVCERTPYLLTVELLENPKHDSCLKTTFQSSRSLSYWRTFQREFFDTYFTLPLRHQIMHQTAIGMSYLHKNKMPHTKLDGDHVLLGPQYNVKVGCWLLTSDSLLLQIHCLLQIVLARTWIHSCFSGVESIQDDVVCVFIFAEHRQTSVLCVGKVEHLIELLPRLMQVKLDETELWRLFCVSWMVISNGMCMVVAIYHMFHAICRNL